MDEEEYIPNLHFCGGFGIRADGYSSAYISGDIAARKTLKEELLLLLSKGDIQEKMSLSMIAKALNGDVKAFEVIRDTIGEKPVEKIDNVNPQVQKIFITKEDTKKANKLIDEFIEK